MPNLVAYFFLFLLGLILGSFLNVVILRDNHRASILSDRSRCMHCKHILTWYDLIPLFSFLWLGAKCRYCKKPISWQYPFVELLSGVLTFYAFWFGYVQHHSILLAATLIITLLILLAIAIIDLRTMELSVEYCLAAGLIGALGMILSKQHTLATTLWGVGVGAGIIAFITYGWLLLFKKQGMGSGDIWLTGALGAIVGYPQILVLLMAAILIGAVIGILTLGISKKTLQAAIPFGPFLFIATLITLQWGQALVHWYII